MKLGRSANLYFNLQIKSNLLLSGVISNVIISNLNYTMKYMLNILKISILMFSTSFQILWSND